MKDTITNNQSMVMYGYVIVSMQMCVCACMRMNMNCQLKNEGGFEGDSVRCQSGVEFQKSKRSL